MLLFFEGKGGSVKQLSTQICKKSHLHIQIIHPFGIDVGYTLNAHNYHHLRKWMIPWM